MPMKKKTLAAIGAGLLMAANPASAQMLGFNQATETTQLAHLFLHQAGNSARLAELLKHTESWMQQLMTMTGGIAASDIAEFRWMITEVSRVRQSMAEIIYDPAGYGSYDKYNEFVGMQQGRSAKRLEDVAIGMENLETRAAKIGQRTAELMAANTMAKGGIEVQQIGNEASGLNVDIQRQQLVVMMEQLRSDNEAEARELENQLLAFQRWCAVLPELESCGTAVR